MTLEGKTLFISGGSRGIGLAIAMRAARPVVGPRDQACSRVLVRRHNRCACGPGKGHVVVPPAH